MKAEIKSNTKSTKTKSRHMTKNPNKNHQLFRKHSINLKWTSINQVCILETTEN